MKKIRIGNQTSFAASPLLGPFEYAAENGFDAFEWFPDRKESGAGWDEGDLSAEERNSIKKLAAEKDIALSVHAPWHFNPLQNESSELISRYIGFAHDIGASLINIHIYNDRGIEGYINAIVPIINQTAEARIGLSIENTPLTTPDDFNEMFMLLRGMKKIESGHLGICLDIGHANLCDAYRNDYLGFIDSLASDLPIIHMHLHENYGDIDSHLPIFTGPAGENDEGIRGLLIKLKERRFRGSIILEQWPEDPSLLNRAREKLLDLWDADHRLMVEESGKVRNPPAGQAGVRQGPKPGSFVKTIIYANKRNKSWREKLGWVSDLFYDDNFRPDLDKLIYLSIYLRFLGTGELRCSEDGRHFRPNHHAGISHRIEESLARLTTAENTFIMKKIYPWLPSHDSAFTRSEPLTRIRDIAHRNDIPKELKKEIKHTLQNKLHRCADPEDLRTSSNILDRITAVEAEYAPAFVKEFRIFHEELKEFFNAQSLDQRLGMISQGEIELAELVKDFLELKKDKNHTPGQIEAVLQLLTKLREELLIKIVNDSGADQQQARMADIGLEDFAFVILSSFILHLEKSWAPVRGNGNGQEIIWEMVLNVLSMTVTNLHLSGIEPDECEVIESELAAWSERFDPRRAELLRLKATLDRCARLCDEFTDRIVSVFQEKVGYLGHALGIDKNAIDLYSEGEIRGNPVFQFSKLVSLLLRNIRKILDLSPWDVLVTGNGSGRLIVVDRMNDLEPDRDERVIVLLKDPEGDENIPAFVNGLILGRQLPHLSHLGVRARQERVALAACEDARLLGELERNEGKQLKIRVVDGLVEWGAWSGSEYVESDGKNESHDYSGEIDLSDKNVLTMNMVTRKNAGAKAKAAARLEKLAAGSDTLFLTPPGVAIPFGVNERSIHSDSALERKYRSLVNGLDDLTGPDVNNTLGRLRKITAGLDLDDNIIHAVENGIDNNGPFMIRSSANCEDMEGLSGAGLFETVANVPISGLRDAIRKVWASVWTDRVAHSIRDAGIPFSKVKMAVLIQRMILPDYSFIMHTVNPVSNDRDEIYIELAVGMGEALASGAIGGVPYRIVCNRSSGELQILSYASFSYALVPDETSGLSRKRINYTNIELTANEEALRGLSCRLAGIGSFIENEFGSPQDIEGVIAGDDIYIVQSRPQQGVNPIEVEPR